MSDFSVTDSKSQISNLQMQNKTLGKNPPPKPNIEDMLNRLTEDLNLSSEQKTKLTEIFKQDMAAIDSEKSDSSSKTKFDPEKMQTKMDEINNKIKSILNEDQIAEFDKINEKRKLEHQQKTESFESLLNKKNDTIISNADSESDTNNVDIYI